MAHLQRTILSRIALLSVILGVLLASVRLLLCITSSHAFWVVLRPLYDAALAGSPQDTLACDGFNTESLDQLSRQQRFNIGSILISVGCIDTVPQILPQLTGDEDRSGLLAYQWGLLAWERGDTRLAATVWREATGASQRLLEQARRAGETDITDTREAQQWYEAAIMSASSVPVLTESITAYTEELRGRMPSETFRERLAYLESYFGTDVAIGYRLRGQRSLLEGSYGEAYEQLSKAVELGIGDAETWYLLGMSAQNNDDLVGAETALRSALAASLQVPGRRPWHLFSLGALLLSSGRATEAIAYLEEAAYRPTGSYFEYADTLSIAYEMIGDTEKAHQACALAQRLATTADLLDCRQ